MSDAPHDAPGKPARRLWLALLLIVGAALVAAPKVFRELRSLDLPDAGVMLATAAVTNAEDVDILLTQPPWAGYHGDGEGEISAESRAVRLGAAIADAGLSYQRSHPSLRTATERVVTLLKTFPAHDDAVRAYETFGVNANASSPGSASSLAERLADRRLVRLGSWLRSARFATAARDTLVFTDAAVRSVSESVRTYDVRPETEFSLRQFEAIARERPHDWTALATSLEELLRRLGSLGG